MTKRPLHDTKHFVCFVDNILNTDGDKFFEVDEKVLAEIINNFPNKKCASDPDPTWLLKRIATPVLVILNSSFESETVRQDLKLFDTNNEKPKFETI